MTLNGVADDPPVNSRFTTTTPESSDPVNRFCVNLTLITKIVKHYNNPITLYCKLLLVSMIVAVAIVIAPAIIPGETGTFKFIVNVSSPSTMLSSTTVMFTVLLLLPAVIVAVCVAELKSSPSETRTSYKFDKYCLNM